MKKITFAMLIFTAFSINIITANAYTLKKAELEKINQEISEQGTNELINLYNEQNFILGPQWFDENGKLLPVKIIDVKYVETSTFVSSKNDLLNIIKEKEITASDYQNWTAKQTKESCPPGFYNECWETTAKRVFIAYHTYPSGKEAISVINQWKTMPLIRSFDTIGMVFNNFEMTSYYGTQWYNTKENQEYQSINYSYGSPNIKISNSTQKGISISQNIVDDTYNYLQNDLYVYGKKSENLQVAGSYQHAVKNLDLATSKNFTFDAWGMGKVFNWNTSWSNWDNMQGVCINWSPYLWTC